MLIIRTRHTLEVCCLKTWRTSLGSIRPKASFRVSVPLLSVQTQPIIRPLLKIVRHLPSLSIPTIPAILMKTFPYNILTNYTNKLEINSKFVSEAKTMEAHVAPHKGSFHRAIWNICRLRISYSVGIIRASSLILINDFI